MIKKVGFLFLFIISMGTSAQENTEEKKVKKVIQTFFEALHTGNSILMETTLHKDIKIQTTGNSKEGISFLKTDSREKLLKSVANKNPDHTYLEKLISFTIKIDDNLASIWTLYEFYFNGKFSHCGANSFQLFKENDTWKIIYLVDSRKTENCNVLKDKK